VRNESAGTAGAGPLRPKLGRSVVLGLGLGLFGAVVALLPWTLAVEEMAGLGGLFGVRGAWPAPADVVIVGISRDAARDVGRTTELDTWSRGLHADLVDELTAAGARLIVFDLRFDEPRDAEGDRRFAESIARAGNVLLLEWTREEVVPLGGGRHAFSETYEPPLPELKAGALGSAPFVLPRVPVRVSQFWTFGRATTETPALPAVALQGALLHHYGELLAILERAEPGVTAAWPPSEAAVRAGRNLELTVRSIRRAFESRPALAAAAHAQLDGAEPLAAESRAALRLLLDLYEGPGSRYLNPYGPARAMTTIRYDRALAGAPGVDMAGKVVFVGLSEPRPAEQQDYFYSVFSERSGIDLSGVELGATAVANLLEHRALEPLPLRWHLLAMFAFGAVVGTLIGSLPLRAASAAFVGGSALYAVVAYWQFASAERWLPLAVPLLMQAPAAFAVALWWGFRELAAQRERVRTALGYYVPPALARRLAAQTVTIGVGRRLLHGTCLVTDAEQYTAVAERLAPDELASLMNDYYAQIFRVVQAYGGEISDTAGDSMVAVWASAKPDAGARARAAHAAVAILAAIDEFNARQTHRLPTRVGVEFGQLLFGNIGAEQRYEYRAIGDIVNTAARIQGLNQLLGTRALVSAAALEGVAGLATRPVGTFLLRGKLQPVGVHEPLAAGVALDSDGLAAFAAALAAFRAASWPEAHERFAALAARFPADGPSRYYAALAARYGREPPVEWRGAVRVSAK
jgi:adenylate cyclase